MSDDNGPKVPTVSGTVRGRWTEGLAVFAVSLSRGPRSAPCASPHPGSATGTDWLTVNIWSPEPGAGRLPVLVWFQGSAYLSGTSSDPLYDVAPLARTGLVIVTFNHRVGAEGFAQLSGARPTVVCSTRSRGCAGRGRTSPASGATPTGSLSAGSRPGPVRSRRCWPCPRPRAHE